MPSTVTVPPVPLISPPAVKCNVFAAEPLEVIVPDDVIDPLAFRLIVLPPPLAVITPPLEMLPPLAVMLIIEFAVLEVIAALDSIFTSVPAVIESNPVLGVMVDPDFISIEVPAVIESNPEPGVIVEPDFISIEVPAVIVNPPEPLGVMVPPAFISIAFTAVRVRLFADDHATAAFT